MYALRKHNLWNGTIFRQQIQNIIYADMKRIEKKKKIEQEKGKSYKTFIHFMRIR